MNVLFFGFKRYGSVLGIYWLTLLLMCATFIPAAVFAVPAIIMTGSGSMTPVGLGMIMIGGLITLVIGIYVGLGLCLANNFMMDRGYGAWQSIKASWEMLAGKRLDIFFILFVSGLINILGVLMCCVGVLVTFPIGIAAMASIYHRLSMQQAIANPAPPNSNFGPPPFGEQPPFNQGPQTPPPANWDTNNR